MKSTINHLLAIIANLSKGKKIVKSKHFFFLVHFKFYIKKEKRTFISK